MFTVLSSETDSAKSTVVERVRLADTVALKVTLSFVTRLHGSHVRFLGDWLSRCCEGPVSYASNKNDEVFADCLVCLSNRPMNDTPIMHHWSYPPQFPNQGTDHLTDLSGVVDWENRYELDLAEQLVWSALEAYVEERWLSFEPYLTSVERWADLAARVQSA